VATVARSLSFRDEWRVATLDITIAVLLGVVQAVVVVTGALDYFARALQTLGVGGFIGSMIIVSFYGPLILTSGFLRKRILVPVIAGTVLAVIRWFTGDPNGAAQLIWWGIGGLVAGATLWAFRWREVWWVYGVAGSLTAAWAGGSWWLLMGVSALGWGAYAVSQPTLFVAGFVITGLLGFAIGKAIRGTGIAVVER
jgi:hypothetical protein